MSRYAALALASISTVSFAQDVTIDVQNVDAVTSTFDIHYSTTRDIAGFQLTVTGVTINGFGGGLVSSLGWTADYNPGAGIFLAFGFGASPIPAGSSRRSASTAWEPSARRRPRSA